MSGFGINLGFAIKRWPEPRQWARIVRDELELDSVQFTFDLLDPWWPEHRALARRVRKAADDQGIAIHSAQVGLAMYTYNGLLHPDGDARAAAMEWWMRACAVAVEMGASAMGGPVGALSFPELRSGNVRKRRYEGLVESLRTLAAKAGSEGLGALLVEPTPLPREIPSTVEESQQLADDLQDTAIPVRYVLDVGHALFRPLYGDVALASWLEPLAPHIGVIHLQNTDFLSDSHWGWPDSRGLFDVEAFARDVHAAGLDEVPVFLELFDPFEADDEAVLEGARSSVAHCRRALQTGDGR